MSGLDNNRTFVSLVSPNITNKICNNSFHIDRYQRIS